MKRFIPKEKLGKKARKRLDSGQRATWAFPPATRKIESKKVYSRKKRSHDRYDDYGMGSFTVRGKRLAGIGTVFQPRVSAKNQHQRKNLLHNEL